MKKRAPQGARIVLGTKEEKADNICLGYQPFFH